MIKAPLHSTCPGKTQDIKPLYPVHVVSVSVGYNFFSLSALSSRVLYLLFLFVSPAFSGEDLFRPMFIFLGVFKILTHLSHLSLLLPNSFL
jgi:hypothetical protein